MTKIKDEYTLSKRYTYRRLKNYLGLESNTPIINNNTFVGIEIELENYHYSQLPATWNVEKDDSLKLDGKELVTIPIKLKYLDVELGRAIEGTKQFSVSSRCSVHVHVNVRDFNQEELLSFLGLYMIFEKALFNFSGNRWNNNYCTPLYFNPEITKDFVENQGGFATTNWYKYSALNLCPIWGGESKKYGTAEFRHMEGCLDREKIMNWVNLIVGLKIAAKIIPLNELKMHIKTMNTSSAYYWLVEKVFGNWSKLLTDQSTFKEDIESCISRTKISFLSLPIVKVNPFSASKKLNFTTTTFMMQEDPFAMFDPAVTQAAFKIIEDELDF